MGGVPDLLAPGIPEPPATPCPFCDRAAFDLRLEPQQTAFLFHLGRRHPEPATRLILSRLHERGSPHRPGEMDIPAGPLVPVWEPPVVRDRELPRDA